LESCWDASSDANFYCADFAACGVACPSDAVADRCWGLETYDAGLCGGTELESCWDASSDANFYCADFAACGVACPSDAVAERCWNLPPAQVNTAPKYDAAKCGGTRLQSCWDAADSDKFYCADFAACGVACPKDAVAKRCWSLDTYDAGKCGGTGLKSCWDFSDDDDYYCAEFAACGVKCSDEEIAKQCWGLNTFDAGKCGGTRLQSCWDAAAREYYCADFIACGVSCPSDAVAQRCWSLDTYDAGKCGGTELKSCWDAADDDDYYCADFAACGVECKVTEAFHSIYGEQENGICVEVGVEKAPSAATTRGSSEDEEAKYIGISVGALMLVGFLVAGGLYATGWVGTNEVSALPTKSVEGGQEEETA